MSFYKNITILLFLCQSSSSVKGSLSFSAIISSGIRTLPNIFTAQIDEIQVDYFDSNGQRRQSSVLWKNISDSYTSNPFTEDHLFFLELILKVYLNRLESLNSDEDVHVLQCRSGCEVDENVLEVVTFHQCGYNGDDFIKLDFENLTWIVQNSLAESFKPEWDSDQQGSNSTKLFLSLICPQMLSQYVTLSALQGEDLTSISLLQKTPFSSVSCFATGFYPNTAVMFWRRDGEQVSNNVGPGETLLNHDNTYQMSVYLNVSSIASEDWRRYDCVFQYNKKTVVTRLEKAAIRTNWVPEPPYKFPVDLAIGLVVGLVLLCFCISGIFMWKNFKNASYFPDKPSYPSYPNTIENVQDNIEFH